MELLRLSNYQQEQSMTRKHINLSLEEVNCLLGQDRDFLKPLLQELVQQILDAQMEE